MMRAFKNILITYLLLGAAYISSAATYAPSIKWMERDTEHFIIIYDAEQAALADSAAVIAERAHAAVTGLLGHVPDFKTAILLADNVDAVSAYTSMLWYPHIVVAPAPGAPLDLDGASAPWLDLVITHEFTHAVQQDMTGGIPGMLRDAFGRIVLNNAFQPYWAIEGPAVYAESKFTGAGRMQGGIYDMMLRTAVRDDRLLGIDQIANYDLVRWPAGGSSYIYGTALMDDLTARYGDDAVARFNHRYKRWPFMDTDVSCVTPCFCASFSKITGDWATRYYREWIRTLKKRQNAVIDSIVSRGETPSRTLTRHGYATGSPAWFPDRDVLAYTCSSRDLHPQLRVLDPETGRNARVRTFINGASRSAVAVSPDGARLAYAELMPRGQYALYSDLYLYDLRSHRTVRVTDGARAKDPSWSPDGNRLAYVAGGAAGSNLAVVGADGAGSRLLTDRTGCVFSRPAWSPEGNRIVTSLTRRGETRLCLYDFTAPDSLVMLTDGTDLATAPAWSPDGKYVVFSSNRTGVFNLYALNPQAGTLTRITNLVGGAFDPAVAPDGKRIAYTGYSSGGYDIHLMDVGTGTVEQVAGYAPGTYGSLACRDPKPLPGPADADAGHSYRPWRTLRPQFWYPWAGFDGYAPYLGGGTVCADVLGRHQLSAEVLLAPAVAQADYGVTYAYRRFRPVFYTTARRSTWGYGYRDGVLERADAFGGGCVLPGVAGFSAGIFHSETDLSLSYLSLTEIDTASYRTRGAGERYAAAALETHLYGYDYYRASISPENGLYAYGHLAGGSDAFGSSSSFTNAYAQLRLYLPSLFPHHVLVPSGGWLGRTGDAYWGDAGTGRLYFGSLEYRLPLWYPDTGLLTLPFFLSKVSGRAYAQVAGHPDYRASEPLIYGADLSLHMTLMHSTATALTAGVSTPGDGSLFIYFDIGVPMFDTYATATHHKEQDLWDLRSRSPRISRTR